jgi:hypothetical protein
MLNLPPFAILPKAHRLSAGKTVSLEDLSREPFVMLDLPHSREYFSSLFDGLGARPVPAFKSSQPEVVKGMVERSWIQHSQFSAAHSQIC